MGLWIQLTRPLSNAIMRDGKQGAMKKLSFGKPTFFENLGDADLERIVGDPDLEVTDAPAAPANEPVKVTVVTAASDAEIGQAVAAGLGKLKKKG